MAEASAMQTQYRSLEHLLERQKILVKEITRRIQEYGGDGGPMPYSTHEDFTSPWKTRLGHIALLADKFQVVEKLDETIRKQKEQFVHAENKFNDCIKKIDKRCWGGAEKIGETTVEETQESVETRERRLELAWELARLHPWLNRLPIPKPSRTPFPSGRPYPSAGPIRCY
jgi:hypothetical protein